MFLSIKFSIQYQKCDNFHKTEMFDTIDNWIKTIEIKTKIKIINTRTLINHVKLFLKIANKQVSERKKNCLRK